MSETTGSIVVIEPIENIGNEIIELNLKYENLSNHGYQTLKYLDAMRKERQLCDIILTVEGHELFAHRALLACYSNYFFELFLNDENDISTKKQIYYQIDGLEHQSLKLILQFIYQGCFQLTPDMVPKIYLASHQLRIESIFKACSNYLSEKLNPNNCLSIRLMAIDDDLRNKANECIEENFISILDTREFHLLPSVQLELIGSTILNRNFMCELIINWIIQQLQKENMNLQELGEYMHLLYLNGDRTLHDCADMDTRNSYFSDLIKDYQSYRLSKRHYSVSLSEHEDPIFEKPILQLNNNHSLIETKLIHIRQSTEHSYIAIAIIKGKMLSITIHISPVGSAPSHATDNRDDIPTENITEDNHLTNGFSSDKDIPLASLSIARCGFGIVSTNEYIYAVGGYDRGDCLDTIEQYDPIDNKWTLLSIPMNSRRGRVSAAIVKNKIYVCGGSDGQEELNTGEVLDLESMDKWLPIQDLNAHVAYGAMCSDDAYIYLIGGSAGDRCKNTCYRYDPENNLWSTLSPMNCQRSQATVIYFDNRLYVFGGYTLNRCLSSCEILNLSTNEWSFGPSMREHRRGSGAILYNNKIYIIGGSNGVTSLTSIEVFDPIKNEWIQNLHGTSQELNLARVGVGVIVCNDNLYAIGGFDGRNFLKSMEIYDQNHQHWKLTLSKD